LDNIFLQKVDDEYLINTKPQRIVRNTAQWWHKECLYTFEIRNTIKN